MTTLLLESFKVELYAINYDVLGEISNLLRISDGFFTWKSHSERVGTFQPFDEENEGKVHHDGAPD